MGINHAVLTRIVLAVATLFATTFGDDGARADVVEEPASRTVTALAAPAANVDVNEVVLAFGDALGELHNAVAFDDAALDPRRVDRACDDVLSQYPVMRAAVGDRGVDLLVAAESMVDACRRGFADTLGPIGFEIVDGDYYTYRELSLTFTE